MTRKECDVIEECILELAIDGINSKVLVADKLIDLIRKYYYKNQSADLKKE